VTSLAPAAVTRASVLLDSTTRQRLRAVLVSNTLPLVRLLLAVAEGWRFLILSVELSVLLEDVVKQICSFSFLFISMFLQENVFILV
jgi:hypothetical protein